QILDAYAVTGDFDYILRVITPDLAAFSAFLSEDLMAIAGIRSVRSNVVLEAIKQTQALPLGHLGPAG
ncbi:Lrp/AsnC ligand binding domain-containing protein, partial [Staphylococcus aureus]